MTKASRLNNGITYGSSDTENGAKKLSGIKRQPGLFEQKEDPLPGSMNDAALIRSVLVQSIKRSGKSRAQIAEDMSRLVGREITERQLNGFTAESREDYPWKGELDRAFCAATGDDTLLKCRAELAGYKVISEYEVDLLELGRQYLLQKRAIDGVSLLEAKLRGVEL